MIIVIGNEKGGVAKTATATNLVVRAIDAGIDTLLIDTDNQGSSRSWCRIRNSSDIKPYVPLKSDIDDFKKDLLQQASKYQLVIVDIGAQDYPALVACSMEADMVILPTGPDQMELESTIMVVRALRKLDDEHRFKKMPLWVLMTRTPMVRNSREEAALRETLIANNMPLLDSALRDRSVWRASRREGKAVHEMRTKKNFIDPKAAAETEELFTEVMDKLATLQEEHQANKLKTGTEG
jgi:chromosome partitioning protein